MSARKQVSLAKNVSVDIYSVALDVCSVVPAYGIHSFMPWFQVVPQNSQQNAAFYAAQHGSGDGGKWAVNENARRRRTWPATRSHSPSHVPLAVFGDMRWRTFHTLVPLCFSSLPFNFTIFSVHQRIKYISRRTSTASRTSGGQQTNEIQKLVKRLNICV